MSWLRRSFVDGRLRLARRQSYRIVGADMGERISSESVLDLLNGCAVNADVCVSIPDDLARPDELADGQVTEHDIKTWCHRRMNPLPHYRLNSHAIRISRSQYERWMRRSHERRT